MPEMLLMLRAMKAGSHRSSDSLLAESRLKTFTTDCSSRNDPVCELYSSDSLKMGFSNRSAHVKTWLSNVSWRMKGRAGNREPGTFLITLPIIDLENLHWAQVDEADAIPLAKAEIDLVSKVDIQCQPIKSSQIRSG
jgi:hypothetical protein